MAAAAAAKIAPSMLSSDFANLAAEADRMVRLGADWLHMDIMVTHFVPNLTIGAPVIQSLRKHTKAYLDCHLMVTNPSDYVEPLAKAGASGFTFHIEVSRDNWQELIQSIKAKGMRPGVSLRPGTPVEEVFPLVIAQYNFSRSHALFPHAVHNYDINAFLNISNKCSNWEHFVPNLTIGAPVIQSLRKHTKAYLDCHLMVTNPSDYVEPLAKAGASGFTFHIEVSRDNWQELIQSIKAKGMRPGVSLRPGTPVEEVFPLVEAENPVELVLVMTVEPGFGGQKFMPEMMEKVRALRKKYPSLDIEVDGGLGPSTIDVAASAGANCIVAGSSIFGAAEPGEVISALRKSVEGSQNKS
ncbi:hypothetical protein OsJ_29932 [Oryza sativa Japonica Group]|uniref:ribulose-phosphate 3-epimerase n=1 Tax=Oryza sativa subsp. japonica TaxID=39947 RepID=A3C0F1_ORYSJ|nr:hypothetical protein OsJ_29932 [Oryza sativa Japonica Group]